MEFVTPSLNVMVLAPQIIVAVTAMVVLLMAVFDPLPHPHPPAGEGRGGGRHLAVLSLIGLVLAGLTAASLWGQPSASFQGMAVLDHFALFLDLVILGIAALVVLMSVSYLPQQGIERGEYYALLLFATFGMMLMGASTDLIALFLGLETFSLALYVLAGFARPRLESEESALKYFLIGSFASGFLLYGVALIYGATGTTNLVGIARYLVMSSGMVARSSMTYLGLGLLVVGFGYKIAMVPFHMWTPDVYEGAPTSVTAFMAAGTKAAGFAAFLRVLLATFPALRAEWVPLVALLAVLTMTVGNVIALMQNNIKRMLAYSSIAHAGYVLVAVVAGNQAGAAALFYLPAYALMTLGAFAVVIALGRPGQEATHIPDYAGLASRQPFLAAMMALFMFALAGFPPTAGFVGKFYMFGAAVEAGLAWLAVIAVLNSVLSVAYYARVVVLMYMREPTGSGVGVNPGMSIKLAPGLVAAVVLAAVGTLWFGVFPAGLIDLARDSILAML
jgi:NADH-quinone oxidoreductase subunit N